MQPIRNLGPYNESSNGMSIALLINQFVSTLITAMFLPTVGFYGYSTVFFVGKGKTLEEIELHFTGAGKPQAT